MSRRKRQKHDSARVMLHVACNEDGGIFTGLAEALQIERRGETLDLDCCGRGGPRFTILDDRIRIFRRSIATFSHASCVGNLCWDAFTISVPDAAFVLCAALRSGNFSVDGASGDAACSLSELLDVGASEQLVETMLAQFGQSKR